MKSIIKWVGGKTQLISDIINNLPDNREHITTYIEPFIGGASVLINIIDKFPNIKNVIIGDLNPVLTTMYLCIKKDPNYLISILSNIDSGMRNSIDPAQYYLNIRDKFNIEKQKLNNINVESLVEYDVLQANVAAMFIFLNKTCFNGLYRENKSGEFNVPYNKSIPVTIFDINDILNLSKLLNEYNVQIITDSYINTVNLYLTENTFVYFDPPYRPINKTSAFTAYTKSGFNDNNQIELANLCNDINAKGSYFMLSNSDPHNTDINDNFFDDLYKGYNIQRVYASRSINSNGSKRGKITELLITNY